MSHSTHYRSFRGWFHGRVRWPNQQCTMHCNHSYLEDFLSVLLCIDVGIVVSTRFDKHSQECFSDRCLIAHRRHQTTSWRTWPIYSQQCLTVHSLHRHSWILFSWLIFQHAARIILQPRKISLAKTPGIVAADLIKCHTKNTRNNMK